MGADAPAASKWAVKVRSNRIRRARARAAGICGWAGCEEIAAGYYCEQHKAQHAANKRAAYARKKEAAVVGS